MDHIDHIISNVEKKYIEILADYLNCRDTRLNELTNAEWAQIWKIAKIQQTRGILWKQCGKILLEKYPELAKRVHTGFQAEVYRSVYYREDLKEVKQLLDHAGVPYTLMKGSVISELYSEPLLRTMSDIDVIIHAEDRMKSHEAMVSADYSYIVPTDAEYVYNRGEIEYEFHDRMISEPLANDFDYEKYFSHVWEHVGAPKQQESKYHPMNESFHFLFLLVHIAKHVLDAGMGIRAYMDLPIVAREYGDKLDWPWIKTELERMQLDRFAAICSALCERWFEIGFPISPAKITDDFYTNTTRKILGEGIYGHEDVENTTGYTAKTVKKSRLPYWLISILILIERIFPRYENVRLIEWYSFVNGRPWMLPLVWIYRWGYVLRNKRELGAELLTESVRKKNIIEKRQKYYSDWGL